MRGYRKMPPGSRTCTDGFAQVRKSHRAVLVRATPNRRFFELGTGVKNRGRLPHDCLHYIVFTRHPLVSRSNVSGANFDTDPDATEPWTSLAHYGISLRILSATSLFRVHTPSLQSIHSCLPRIHPSRIICLTASRTTGISPIVLPMSAGSDVRNADGSPVRSALRACTSDMAAGRVMTARMSSM